MNAATIRLHERLIALAKGLIKAWEDWLKEAKEELTTK
jgi:hypothetical protein